MLKYQQDMQKALSNEVVKDGKKTYELDKNKINNYLSANLVKAKKAEKEVFYKTIGISAVKKH